MPDAGIVVPGVSRADRRFAALDGMVPHDKFSVVRHARKRDPDQRFTRPVPRVDFVGDAVRLHVDEAEIVPVRVVEVGVEEAIDGGLGKPHEDGEVGEDFRSRVARDGKFNTARELGDGRIGARKRRLGWQRERTERQHRDKQRDSIRREVRTHRDHKRQSTSHQFSNVHFLGSPLWHNHSRTYRPALQIFYQNAA